MSVYADLLFMQGHIVNVELARQLAESDATASKAEPTTCAGAAPQERQRHEQAGAAGRATAPTLDSCLNR